MPRNLSVIKILIFMSGLYLSNDSIKDFMESIRNAKKIIDFAKNNAKENNQ